MNVNDIEAGKTYVVRRSGKRAVAVTVIRIEARGARSLGLRVSPARLNGEQGIGSPRAFVVDEADTIEEI